jgi:hypothetical protein
VCHLLRREGFVDVFDTSRPGGGDLGKDIEMLEEIPLKTGKNGENALLVKCKNSQSKNIDYSKMVAKGEEPKLLIPAVAIKI